MKEATSLACMLFCLCVLVGACSNTKCLLHVYLYDQLQAEVTAKTAECARLTELSVIAANRSEDETQRNNEVVLLRKDNEELQNQL